MYCYVHIVSIKIDAPGRAIIVAENRKDRRAKVAKRMGKGE
jgi:hypothetical protein